VAGNRPFEHQPHDTSEKQLTLDIHNNDPVLGLLTGGLPLTLETLRVTVRHGDTLSLLSQFFGAVPSGVTDVSLKFTAAWCQCHPSSWAATCVQQAGLLPLTRLTLSGVNGTLRLLDRVPSEILELSMDFCKPDDDPSPRPPPSLFKKFVRLERVRTIVDDLGTLEALLAVPSLRHLDAVLMLSGRCSLAGTT